MRHNESCAKRKVHSAKYLRKLCGMISYQQLSGPPESSRIKSSKHTQGE